ncbi:MAG: hypothetical protein JHD02_01355 [Thermoleophilaceae bacterium]|nr:hypothetical protein [Thermoleophilaceae bacterium]
MSIFTLFTTGRTDRLVTALDCAGQLATATATATATTNTTPQSTATRVMSL